MGLAGRMRGRRRARAGIESGLRAEAEGLVMLRAELGGHAVGRDGGRWTARGPDGLALSRASARGLRVAVKPQQGRRAVSPRYRDTGAIDRAALRRLAGNCLDEHPGWTDEKVISGLAVAYPGHEPGQLRAVIAAALAEARLGRQGPARAGGAR